METSFIVGSAIPNLPEITSRYTAVAADTSVTDSGQVDSDDASDIWGLSKALSALDGLGEEKYEAMAPMDSTNNRSKPASERAVEIDSDEDRASDRGGNNLGRHATPPLPEDFSTKWVSSETNEYTNNLSHSSFLRGSFEPTQDFNNKREVEINPLLPESHWPATNSASRPRDPEWFEVPEDAPAASTIPSQRFNAGLNLEVQPSSIRDTVMAYVKIPQGYNFIQLDQNSDETSVAAYFALQSNKTILIVRKQGGFQLSHYAKIFEAVTQLEVFYSDTDDGFGHIGMKLEALRVANYPAVLLLAHDELSDVLLVSANPDCIVHLGVPLDIVTYVAQLSLLSHPVRSCVVFPWQQDIENLKIRQWQLLNCGIFPYHKTILGICFGPNSPFQLVSITSEQVLAAMNIVPTYVYRERLDLGPSGGSVLLPPPSPPPVHQYDMHPPVGSGEIHPLSMVDSFVSSQQSLASLPIHHPTTGVSSTIPASRGKRSSRRASTWSKNAKQGIFEPPQRSPGAGSVPPSFIFNLQKLVKEGLQVPPGRNYIRSYHGDDVIVLTAYLALINKKTICILPELETLSSYATTLGKMTGLEVLYLDDIQRINSLKYLFEFFEEADYPSLFLLAQNMCPYDLINSAGADCLIHWGLPDIAVFAARVLLTHLMRSYIILLPDEEIGPVEKGQMAVYGITEYGHEVLDAILRSASPVQKDRGIADEAFGPVGLLKPVEFLRNPPTGVQTQRAAPSGHYYIILEHAGDDEVIPLITQTVLGSKKTICYLPVDRDMETYQALEETNLEAVACASSTKGKMIKQAINQFKSKSCCILLRHANSMWASYLAKSSATSLVYWGVPPKIDKYVAACSRWVSHSCLIITTAQHRQILSQRTSTRLLLKEHPHFPSPQFSNSHITA